MKSEETSFAKLSRGFNYDDLPCMAGWGPFLDSEQQEMQQGAGDFLENLLNNGDAESEYRQ